METPRLHTPRLCIFCPPFSHFCHPAGWQKMGRGQNILPPVFFCRCHEEGLRPSPRLFLVIFFYGKKTGCSARYRSRCLASQSATSKRRKKRRTISQAKLSAPRHNQKCFSSQCLVAKVGGGRERVLRGQRRVRKKNSGAGVPCPNCGWGPRPLPRPSFFFLSRLVKKITTGM